VPGATTGQLALAPDNQFHQIRGTVGYDISPTMRITANAAFGRMTQDDGYLPATQNALLAPTVPTLPRQSLHGKVDTFNGGIKLTRRRRRASGSPAATTATSATTRRR
jgi:hypothetical protein